VNANRTAWAALSLIVVLCGVCLVGEVGFWREGNVVFLWLDWHDQVAPGGSVDRRVGKNVGIFNVADEIDKLPVATYSHDICFEQALNRQLKEASRADQDWRREGWRRSDEGTVSRRASHDPENCPPSHGLCIRQSNVPKNWRKVQGYFLPRSSYDRSLQGVLIPQVGGQLGNRQQALRCHLRQLAAYSEQGKGSEYSAYEGRAGENGSPPHQNAGDIHKIIGAPVQTGKE
jgi:hypothetical protein